jgi:hypothetical protein
MFSKKITNERWFMWTLVFLVGSGFSLISYLQWVNLEINTENVIAASEIIIGR